MSRVRALVFDLDGTLVDVDAATVRCVNGIARASGARRLDPAAIGQAARETRGVRARLAAWVAREIGAHGGAAPNVRAITRALGEIAHHVEPDLRVVRTLAHLRERYPVAIVTNGRRGLQRAKLRAAGLAELVPRQRVLVSGELKVRKPDPRIFREALLVTGEPAEATLFVGDDEREDIAGARAVGMRTCRVAPAGTATRADAALEHVEALPEVLACVT